MPHDLLTETSAVRLHAHGEPLSVEKVALPEPGGDDVEVQLEYGGLNPVDRYIAAGRVAADAPLPRTLGGEAAGTLDGTPVLVAGEGLGVARDGVWAGSAIVPRAAVIELPGNVATPEAAAMGIAGLTAWNCVRKVGRVAPKDRVFVLGASGGVGSMICGLASSVGATVWAHTGSDAKAEMIAEHGADRVIVSSAASLAKALSDFEPTVVFDPLGGEYFSPVVEALAPRGRVVNFGTSAGPDVDFNLQTLYRKGASVRGYAGMQLKRKERREGLEAALGALARGEMKVTVDDVLPLSEVNHAFERIERRQVMGKLLLDLRS